jgi:hypothetical protein
MAGIAKMAHSSHGADRTEFRLYAVLSFPIFFAAVLLGRLSPRFAPEPFLARAPRSVFAEAMSLARSVIPWAFMGR